MLPDQTAINASLFCTFAFFIVMIALMGTNRELTEKIQQQAMYITERCR